MLKFEICGLKDVDKVLKVYKKSPTYFKNIEGCNPNEEIAFRDIQSTPSNPQPNYQKCFYIACYDERPIGAVELYINHPDTGTAYLGLLLIEEKLFGQGLGSLIYKHAEKLLKDEFSCNLVKLGVSESNNVSAFWKKLGFEYNRKDYEWQGEGKNNFVKEYEKVIH